MPFFQQVFTGHLLFAGRSVACVDRTVSSGVRGGPGEGGVHSSARAQGEPIGRCPQSEAFEGGAEVCITSAAPSVLHLVDAKE